VCKEFNRIPSQDFLGQNQLDLGKFDTIWAKSKSCIPKNIRSSAAMAAVIGNRVGV